jgi:hypothetical protein
LEQMGNPAKHVVLWLGKWSNYAKV